MNENMPAIRVLTCDGHRVGPAKCTSLRFLLTIAEEKSLKNNHMIDMTGLANKIGYERPPSTVVPRDDKVFSDHITPNVYRICSLLLMLFFNFIAPVIMVYAPIRTFLI